MYYALCSADALRHLSSLTGCGSQRAFADATLGMQVCIAYERKPLNPAWTIQCEPWHVLRMMTQPWTTAYVDILPMHEPSSAERQDAQLYAENVRQIMVRNPCHHHGSIQKYPAVWCQSACMHISMSVHF